MKSPQVSLPGTAVPHVQYILQYVQCTFRVPLRTSEIICGGAACRSSRPVYRYPPLIESTSESPSSTLCVYLPSSAENDKVALSILPSFTL